MPPCATAARRWVLRALLAVLALVSGACQLRLAVEVVVDADGAGTLEVAAALDPELAATLDEAGVDVLRGIEDVAAAAPSWEVEATRQDDGGIAVSFTAPFEDPEEFDALAASLHQALGPDDPRLFETLSLTRAGDGVATLTAEVGLRLPAEPGARGVGVAFDGDDLERLLRERGDEFVRYDVRVTLPAPPRDHDGDQVDGRQVVWQAPVGEYRAISAVSEVPAGTPWWLVVLVGALAALVTILVVLRLRTRLRRRRRVTPAA